MPSNLEITPEDLAHALTLLPAPTLVDVREWWEVQLVPFPGARVIPLGELPSRGPEELDPDQEVVVLCHHGVRSLHAALVLKAAGFAQVRSLRGGVDLWRQRVDPSMRAY